MNKYQKDTLLRAVEAYYIAHNNNQELALKLIGEYINKLIEEESLRCKNACLNIAKDYRDSREPDLSKESKIHRDYAAKVAELCAHRVHPNKK